MTDSNLVRVLSRQTARKVGLVPIGEVARGAAAVRAAFERLRTGGVRFAVTDALTDADLLALGEACADLVLITGGSGIALGLPQNFVRRGLLGANADAAKLPAIGGRAAVLAGSCSEATRKQVAAMARNHPAIGIDPLAASDAESIAAHALAASLADIEAGRVVLFYSSAEPERVHAVQSHLGPERAAALVEDVFARLAVALVERGVRRLVVAGGETSGAVVQALGVRSLAIGPQIDPGVPWTMSLGAPRVALALKSGNFGGEDFFTKALGMMG
jgi:uncharacterized protein YgbK (DUF1537 family)